MNAEIFISYARADVETAKAISDAFGQLGIRCFRDEESIASGSPWTETIADAIRDCKAVLCIISQHESAYLAHEIIWAKKYAKLLLPVLLSRAEPPAEIDLLTNRSQRIYVDPSLQTALPEILRALLPCVDRIKHPAAYTAYTEHTPLIDEADIYRRTDKKHRVRVDLRNDDIGRPAPGLGEGSVHNDKYVLTCYDGSPVTHAFTVLPVATDFVFQARLQRTRGPDRQWFGIEYGCGGHPSGYCYQFLMNGRGELRMAKYGERGWEDPIPLDKARRFGSGAPDVLKIVRNGRNVHVFGNNQLVATLIDSGVRTGKLGPALSPGLTVEFSDIRLDAIPA